MGKREHNCTEYLYWGRKKEITAINLADVFFNSLATCILLIWLTVLRFVKNLAVYRPSRDAFRYLSLKELRHG